jgi:hypothetical protein
MVKDTGFRILNRNTAYKKIKHILLFQIRGLSESEMKPFGGKEEKKTTRLCFLAILPYYTAARVT